MIMKLLLWIKYLKVMIKTIKKFIYLLFNYPDPLKSCTLYKEDGCVHVDGLVCDFPKCVMNKEYCEMKDKQYINQDKP